MKYAFKKRYIFVTDAQVDDTSNDREDCITSEEAIEGNLKKITISADDQTKYNSLLVFFFKNFLRYHT